MQVEPLAMVAFRIGMQLYYSEDSEELGVFDNLEQCFNSLKRNVPAQDYYPEYNKIIMIVHPKNLNEGKLFSQCHGFKVCMVAYYLGGYIRNDKSKGD